ncbi:MAG: DUF1828 domain-containing protein [Dehalococcoidia bacterium]|nr:DUF1828 domain-containing protein [Dehalococcoidia bacterium]
MDIASIIVSLEQSRAKGFDYYERHSGKYQLIIPILHEDGDMVDIYLQDSPMGDGYIRICDFGMTLMRLSYTYDVNTDARQRIFDSILINNGVNNDAGNLYMDTLMSMLYESILQFAGCVQKVCNVRYWSREIIRSAFYDDLEEYVTTELTRFSPIADQTPIQEIPIISVDWSLKYNNRNFYLFGVRGNDKAKNVAIALLEIQKAQLPSFISLVVHEDMEELGRRERLYLTSNADRQYPTMNEFRDKATLDILRYAA